MNDSVATEPSSRAQAMMSFCTCSFCTGARLPSASTRSAQSVSFREPGSMSNTDSTVAELSGRNVSVIDTSPALSPPSQRRSAQSRAEFTVGSPAPFWRGSERGCLEILKSLQLRRHRFVRLAKKVDTTAKNTKLVAPGSGTNGI
jgi:hypothetical protein